MADVHQEGGDLLALAAGRTLLAGGSEQDDKIRVVGVADEVLGAIDDEIATVGDRRGAHAAQV